jgi:hypothetical protein
VFHPVELTLFWGLVKAKSATVPVEPLSSDEGEASLHPCPTRTGKPYVQSQPLRICTQIERRCKTSTILLPGGAGMGWMKGKGHLVRILDLAFRALGG